MEWMMQVVSMRRITVAALVIAGAAGAFALAALVGLDLNFFQEEPGIRVKNGSISFTSTWCSPTLSARARLSNRTRSPRHLSI